MEAELAADDNSTPQRILAASATRLGGVRSEVVHLAGHARILEIDGLTV
jgi:hypothetical protein